MKETIKKYKSAIFLIFVVLGLVGCATQPLPGGDDPPGFWMGIVHGFLILFSMIGSYFSDIRIYAYPNSGSFYDLGYLLGAMMSLGGTGAGVR
jgi:hypothetical protein